MNYSSGLSGRSVIRTSPQRSMNRTMSVSASLLPEAPRPQLDGQGRAARTQEKEAIKGLNNRFSDLIGQMRRLEQENQVLQTRWELLQQGQEYKSNADQIVQLVCNRLQQQLGELERERERLKGQIAHTQRLVDDFKQKYEDEINSRTAMENEFVILKKEVDEAYFQKVQLESNLEYMTNLIEFLKLLFAEEIEELRSKIKSTAVTVTVKNQRRLDMRSVIEDVKLQHADIATRNKAEADVWYQNMLRDLDLDKVRQNEDLHNSKTEAADLSRHLQRLKSDIDGLQIQRGSLETNVIEVDDRGQMTIKEGKAHVEELHEALRQVKTDLADQAREHQELLNATMALDMEIATYRKLLDGEEERDGVPTSGTVRVINSVVPSSSRPNRHTRLIMN